MSCTRPLVALGSDYWPSGMTQLLVEREGRAGPALVPWRCTCILVPSKAKMRWSCVPVQSGPPGGHCPVQSWDAACRWLRLLALAATTLLPCRRGKAWDMRGALWVHPGSATAPHPVQFGMLRCVREASQLQVAYVVSWSLITLWVANYRKGHSVQGMPGAMRRCCGRCQFSQTRWSTSLSKPKCCQRCWWVGGWLGLGASERAMVHSRNSTRFPTVLM